MIINDLKHKSLLEAKRIGDSLISTAIVKNNEAYWIVFDPNRGFDDHFNIYSGNCGILLFLNELYIRIPDEKYSKILKLGINGLKSRWADFKDFDISLFFGHSGLIYTFSQLSYLDVSLYDVVYGLIERSSRSYANCSLSELLSGLSGYFFAVSHAAVKFNTSVWDELLSSVIKCMLKNVKFSEVGIYFDHDLDKISPLISLSHGTSGLVHFFSELYKATGQIQFKWIIRNLLAYEDFYFSHDKYNWPDFRKFSSPNSLNQFINKILSQEFVKGGYPSSFAWCHGAPGIALGRFSWFSQFGDLADLKFLVDIFVQNEAILFNSSSGTLCCGSGGVVLSMMQINSKCHDAKLESLICRGIQSILDSRNSKGYYGGWDSNNFENNNSLFKGDAGIGYALLQFGSFNENSFISRPLIEKRYSFQSFSIDYNGDFINTKSEIRPNMQFILPDIVFKVENSQHLIASNSFAGYIEDYSNVILYKRINFPFLVAIYNIHKQCKVLNFIDQLLLGDMVVFKSPTVYCSGNVIYKCTDNGDVISYDNMDLDIYAFILEFGTPLLFNVIVERFKDVDMDDLVTYLSMFIDQDLLFILPSECKYITYDFFLK